jgi:hypothetical protein
MGRLAVAAAIVCTLVPGSLALASPSGLNNIPTADVTPPGVSVLQLYTCFGEGTGPTHTAGVKSGLARGIEVGADMKVGPDTGTGAFQAKYRLSMGDRLALALGAANVSGDEDANGKWMPYAVGSGDLGGLRLHLGYNGQSGNKGVFVGADAPVGAGVTLRTDWLESNKGDGSLASLGFMWEASSDWVVEGWGSFPSASGQEDSYMLKLDYALPQQ